MDADEFRKMAFSLPEAAYMGHRLRIGGRIFATLSPPEPEWAIVKLSLEQQESFVQAEPKLFASFNGAWGRDRATKVPSSRGIEEYSAHGTCLRLAE